MTTIHRLMLAAIGVTLAAPGVAAQDLSAYRNARLGMNIAAVSKLVDAKVSDATVIYQRPAHIRELVSRSSRVGLGSTPESDPVQDVVFTFYDDALFRIVATYDRAKIAGLTDADLVNGMAAHYGTAAVPAPAITASRLSQAYRDNTEQVIAQWEDAEYSVNLVRSSYASSVSLVMFSKPLEAMARAAIAEGARLDALEAPAREAARKEQLDRAARAARDEARTANKPTFRP